MSSIKSFFRSVGWPISLMIGFFVFIATFGSLVSPYDPNTQNLLAPTESFSGVYWLGTDNLGRDVLSRLIAGAQTTLVGVTIVLFLAGIFGMLVGTISGYFGGWIDEILMRMVDFGLSVPSLVVALAIVGVFGPSYWNMIIALAIAWTPIYARLTRGVVAAAVNQPHIESLRVLGASRLRIIFKHLVPVALGSVLIYASADVGILALAIANLSFLGLGVQPPQAEWGQMLVSSLPYLEEAPRLVILPGLALTIMVVGFNLFGEKIALSKNPRRMTKRSLAARKKLFMKEIAT
ncbi:ABC transporter permease [Mesorhizobium sp. LSJC268A00]|uniref:ABC transporter permease n=1 Tax=unclassified Mesorhizobium TaxID=325217 RepID=UPI0003CDD9CE|nr:MULTISPECIES: ABC transporter permease [unclassified Mesorhizobium]ESW67121.1 ABC transporter permease [Mesorhizobium sp. LSJC277A00]ESW93176.1 ABC transporter permease [Mesorhizobium sp. LSJC269B00]ESX06593.1 ABC transporter permease [Mesorhizobium sp. LSJC268A00]ESX27732.1 ABC transporter permease [Mesorhizobium sp. LSJC264A00]ESZ35158.1 ABC transporter permease [Mesorhizobium sp. L2C067A000]